jgi:hypothetical protein
MKINETPLKCYGMTGADILVKKKAFKASHHVSILRYSNKYDAKSY